MDNVYVITKGRGTTPLNNIWDGEFCMGTKCIEVSNSCYKIFSNKEKAQEYIDMKLFQLENWIRIDIPTQAEKWTNGKEEFLSNNQKRYEQIKKIISNMKVVKRNNA